MREDLEKQQPDEIDPEQPDDDADDEETGSGDVTTPTDPDDETAP
ncbi:MAG TPA: hypothetical protein VEV38_09125 [Candidatus Eremiobacteraceae bacterium]|nr:hypothetical protein [Candidatus Eremiobacteraceae bacterium]